ncbi:unnamed protein product [Moneuplotes crassus]|uniref:NADP-dependent oxidoreductase domain-containing protein n=1 Tax=Euplotes crassus TaxID=5936 RepID=A0AAD1XQC1_EUPCR|nr:unnamed protein product [Moneuplotes crassus]
MESTSPVPMVGFGTWKMENTDNLYKAVVELGYRHILTGHYYENEDMIGQALTKIFEETDIKREDLFISYKLWGTQMKDVEGALTNCLEKFNIDYLDLYMVHFPVAYELDEESNPKQVKIPIHKVWENMELMVEKGLTKQIGVSNFNVQSLLDMMTYAKIIPQFNEIELHPYLTQEAMLRFLKKYKITPIGYCALGRSDPEKGINCEETITEIATKYGKTNAQIAMRWGIQRGYPVISKSSNFERLKLNIDVFDFELTDEEMKTISSLNKNERVVRGENLENCLYDEIFA